MSDAGIIRGNASAMSSDSSYIVAWDEVLWSEELEMEIK